MMHIKWTDHLEILTKKLFPSLEDFKRDDPFPFYPDVWFYFFEYIKSFDHSKVHKSLKISWDYLHIGNEARKDIRERISLYTQSIFYAPQNSPPLVIAYLKRSELLKETGHTKESKIDSAMAFECFVNNSKSLTDFLFMNTNLDGHTMAKLVRETSRKMKIPEELLYYVEFEIMSIYKRRLTAVGSDMLSENDEWNLPALKDGENINFPSTSNALSIEYSKTKGRHVVANTDIKMGDVLFVEKPFSLVVHKLYCTHCCQNSYAYIPCIYCRDVQYCCKVCRDKDWISYHKYECGFVDLLKQTGIGYLALKTFLKAGSDIEKLKNLSSRLKAQEPCGSTVFSKIEYENVYNLLNHSESIRTRDFLQYSLTALLLSFYLIHYAHYAMNIEENIRFCATILLHHIIQLVTNAHSITCTETKVNENFEPMAEEEEEQIGSAIYPSVSVMNHSCEPSVFIIFYKYYIIVKAGKDIKKGKEVFNSYGVDCRRMRRRERQEMLKAQYLFDCKCEPCRQKYDRYDILNSFKCGKCRGPLLKEPETERSARTEDRVCLLCSQHQVIPAEIISVEFYICGLLKLGELYLKENEFFESLKVFVKAWKLSREFFFAFHKRTLYLGRKIALCLFHLDSLKDCMKVLSCNMVCMEGRFGLYSSELAIEAKKLSEVITCHYRNVRKTKSACAPDVLTTTEKEYSRKCKKILKLLYGDDHPIVRKVLQNEPFRSILD